MSWPGWMNEGNCLQFVVLALGLLSSPSPVAGALLAFAWSFLSIAPALEAHAAKKKES